MGVFSEDLFAHLAGLTSWYWAMPYIITIAVMRNQSLKTNRSQFLYLGMAMIVASFVHRFHAIGAESTRLSGGERAHAGSLRGGGEPGSLCSDGDRC